jgi:hypothetical protein
LIWLSNQIQIIYFQYFISFLFHFWIHKLLRLICTTSALGLKDLTIGWTGQTEARQTDTEVHHSWLFCWSCSISSCCNTRPMERPRLCWCRSMCAHNGKRDLEKITSQYRNCGTISDVTSFWRVCIGVNCDIGKSVQRKISGIFLHIKCHIIMQNSI